MGIFDFLFRKRRKALKDSKHVKHNQVSARIYSHDNLKSADYERYILIKGKNLQSAMQKLVEYGELPAKGNAYIYKFYKAKLDDWTIIKLPNDFDDYYGYHNITFWFLGCPPEDTNYADQTVGLAINPNTKLSYII